ncbi:hypothetical protein ACSQ67_006217 [Phaseolus vulgaris]
MGLGIRLARRRYDHARVCCRRRGCVCPFGVERECPCRLSLRRVKLVSGCGRKRWSGHVREGLEAMGLHKLREWDTCLVASGVFGRSDPCGVGSLDYTFAALYDVSALLSPVVPRRDLANAPGMVDNKYYEGLINHRGLAHIGSDVVHHPIHKGNGREKCKQRCKLLEKLAKAMVQMGSIEVLIGSFGEIGKHCSFVN